MFGACDVFWTTSTVQLYTVVGGYGFKKCHSNQIDRSLPFARLSRLTNRLTALIWRKRSSYSVRNRSLITLSDRHRLFFITISLGPSFFLRRIFVYLFRIGNGIHMDFAQIPNQCVINGNQSERVGYLLMKSFRRKLFVAFFDFFDGARTNNGMIPKPHAHDCAE